MNDGDRREVEIAAGDPAVWREVDLGVLPLTPGGNQIRIGAVNCDCSLRAVTLIP